MEENNKTASEKDRRVKKKPDRRVIVIPSNPSTRSVIRVISVSLLILFLLILLILILYQLSFLLFLIVLSIFFAYLLEPLVKLIRRPFKVRNLDSFMPRPLAIVISYLIVFSVLGVAIAYLAPQIAAQIRDFADNLPNYANMFQERITALNNRYEQLMITKEVQDRINKNIGSFVEYTTVTLTAFLGVFAVNAITYFPWILLIPILAFFFLKDAFLYRTMFLNLFPSGRWRARGESLLNDVNSTLAAYTRAQLISCILIGAICTLGFTLIGLDYALLLGILAGIFEFVPLLGPITIGIIAIFVGLFSDNPWLALWTASFLIILRLTHDYVTYPRIVRDGIHLHPFAVILSVLAGEQIAGIPGVFLSIPIVATVTVLYKHILAHSGRTGLFTPIINTVIPDAAKTGVIETEKNTSDEKAV